MNCFFLKLLCRPKWYRNCTWKIDLEELSVQAVSATLSNNIQACFQSGTTSEQMERFQQEHAETWEAFQSLPDDIRTHTTFVYSETTECWSMIGVDENSYKRSWIIDPQRYILDHPPASMNWEKDNIVQYDLEDRKAIYFSKAAVSGYLLSDPNITYAPLPHAFYFPYLKRLLELQLATISSTYAWYQNQLQKWTQPFGYFLNESGAVYLRKNLVEKYEHLSENHIASILLTDTTLSV